MKEKGKLLNWSISIITISLSSMKFWLWRTGDKSLRVKEKFIGKQLISSGIHPDIINKYFCSITSDPEYIAPAPIDIPNGARIPKIPLQVVTSFLSRLKRTASGPDELPYWLFRDFAYDLAPAITDVFNSSLRQHKVPSSWKMADIKPLPKESPLTCCTQLRPISLTAVIMRLFE